MHELAMKRVFVSFGESHIDMPLDVAELLYEMLGDVFDDEHRTGDWPCELHWPADVAWMDTSSPEAAVSATFDKGTVVIGLRYA